MAQAVMEVLYTLDKLHYLGHSSVASNSRSKHSLLWANKAILFTIMTYWNYVKLKSNAPVFSLGFARPRGTAGAA